MQDSHSPSQKTFPKKESNDSTSATNEWRCDCGKLLFKGAFLAGLIEVKCGRCKRMVYMQQFNTYTAENPSFMATLSLDFTILSASQGVEESLGYKVDELVGSKVTKVTPDSMHASNVYWMEGLAEIKDEKNPYSSALVLMKTKSNEEKIFSVLIRPACLGGQDVYIVLAEAGPEAIDTQEQKVLSKISLKNRKKRENWDFVIKSDGTIKDLSNKSDFGYKESDIKNKSLLDLIEEPDKDLVNNLKKQESFTLVIKLKNKNSEVIGYKACFTPDFLADPKDPGFLVAVRPLKAQQ